MIDLIIEEIHNNKGKCIVFAGFAQMQILLEMATKVEYDHNKESHIFMGCEIVEVKRKSFLKIVAI